MPSALDVYEFYLDAADLKDKSHTVKIEAVTLDEMYDPNAKKDVPKIVLHFEKRKKTLPLNKTQAGSMIEITGTDDYTKWQGTEVILTPATARNRKPTITITAAPPEKATA